MVIIPPHKVTAVLVVVGVVLLVTVPSVLLVDWLLARR